MINSDKQLTRFTSTDGARATRRVCERREITHRVPISHRSIDVIRINNEKKQEEPRRRDT